jgi:hypothetical protein
MSRRSKLVYLLSLNAILASAVVALVTAVLTGDADSSGRLASCDTEGTTAREGFVPLNNSLGTIGEAEAYICHDIVYPREIADWRIEHISASRSGPAASVGSGLGFASVTLDYILPGGSHADLRIEVSPFHIDPILYGIVDEVEIMGAKANLIQGRDLALVILQWETDGYSFYTEARLAGGFDLPQLYAILNSIR